MKQVIFKPKPLTRAEQVYFKELENRPADTIFRDVFSKAQNYRNNPPENSTKVDSKVFTG